jgi:hypothetical protein
MCAYGCRVAASVRAIDNDKRNRIEHGKIHLGEGVLMEPRNSEIKGKRNVLLLKMTLQHRVSPSCNTVYSKTSAASTKKAKQKNVFVKNVKHMNMLCRCSNAHLRVILIIIVKG